jgi:hypothetical protein
MASARHRPTELIADHTFVVTETTVRHVTVRARGLDRARGVLNAAIERGQLEEVDIDHTEHRITHHRTDDPTCRPVPDVVEHALTHQGA